MIDKFIELSQACDLKALQEESKNLTINSVDDIKLFFAKKNIEISDRLANELLERVSMKEMTIKELSNVSAGTKWYDTSRNLCPLCGNKTWYERINADAESPHYALDYASERLETICGDCYYILRCTNCNAEFTYWINQGCIED